MPTQKNPYQTIFFVKSDYDGIIIKPILLKSPQKFKKDNIFISIGELDIHVDDQDSFPVFNSGFNIKLPNVDEEEFSIYSIICSILKEEIIELYNRDYPYGNIDIPTCKFCNKPFVIHRDGLVCWDCNILILDHVKKIPDDLKKNHEYVYLLGEFYGRELKDEEKINSIKETYEYFVNY